MKPVHFATAIGVMFSVLTAPTMVTAAPPTPVDANIFVQLAKKIVPSVVNISTTSVGRQPQRGTPDDLFRRFFEDFFRYHGRPGGGGSDEGSQFPAPDSRPGAGAPRSMSLGTGFIIDASGLILTNNHVVAEADEIKIHFTEEADEKPTDGEVVGRDPELDLALIKVKSKRQMIPLTLGDSDSLEVGEYVIAVGNPFGQGHSVTHGIISAKGRKAPEFVLANYLQTDAPINPGNSGGPLVNLSGEVIGINNAIDARAQGIGFAIPSNSVKEVLPQLRTKGTVARGYIGVLVGEMTPEIAAKLGAGKDLESPMVTQVYPNEPADQAGIRPYDIILEFNDKPIRSSSDLIIAVTSVPVGETAPVKVLRGKERKTFKIRVGERPGTPAIAKKDQPKKKDKKSTRIETGMELENLTPDLRRELGLSGKIKGVVVSGVAYGGPADQAGLMRGDVILEVDRKTIGSSDEFYSIVSGQKSYLLRVRRLDPQGRDFFTVVVLDLKK